MLARRTLIKLGKYQVSEKWSTSVLFDTNDTPGAGDPGGLMIGVIQTLHILSPDLLSMDKRGEIKFVWYILSKISSTLHDTFQA